MIKKLSCDIKLVIFKNINQLKFLNKYDLVDLSIVINRCINKKIRIMKCYINDVKPFTYNLLSFCIQLNLTHLIETINNHSKIIKTINIEIQSLKRDTKNNECPITLKQLEK